MPAQLFDFSEPVPCPGSSSRRKLPVMLFVKKIEKQKKICNIGKIISKRYPKE
jgi:hypothetical protein